MERLTRNICPGLLVGTVILVLTGLPGSCFERVDAPIGTDKLVHVAMFGAFAFAALWGYRTPYDAKGKARRTRALLAAAAVGIALGGLTEIMQETLVSQRTGSLYDFIADAVGSLFGACAFAISRKKKNKMARTLVL